MRSGKMGAVVIMIAIVATLGVSWVMSMDVTETEVTKYRPLADISGEFQTGQTPQFVEYNPSTNYTGYYTDNSIINDTRYFDGVEFTPSERANNFRVQEMPTTAETTSKDLSSYESTHSYAVKFWVRTTGIKTLNIDPNAVTIQELIGLLGYDGIDVLEVTNVGNVIDWESPTSYVALIFDAMTQLTPGSDNIALKNPNITTDTGSGYPTTTWTLPIMACRYDASANSVELFYDNDMTQSVGIYTPDKVHVLYGKRSGATADTPLGNSIQVTALDFPDPQYMDPSQGVELS